ncbi:MAG: D-alanyl-D-alanine carboxypeptidase [Clostridiales bacterium]|nr:D-alanyl-D-alanine carboxypeptidase [Clostridiales bacterium]
MKKKTWSFRRLVVVLCCTVLSMLGSHADAEDRQPDTGITTSAKAAVLIERSTGTILLRSNEALPLPMASTTKVMTALLALEKGNLDDVVTVGRNAYGVPGTSIYLSQGEQITLRNLLYGLLMASGNDAAVAIAEHIGGDVDTFCRMMTERAAQLGCTDTVFVNPHGLPADGHHTTAYDLALIAREAMNHPLFREIVSTRRASIPWEGRSYHRILNNKNRLLSDYDGAFGIKTGYTKAAGRCLVFGARRGDFEVIGVVLCCGNWFEEAARIMDLGFERYDFFTAFSPGETVRALPVENGIQETVSIRTSGLLGAPVVKGCLPSLEYDLPSTVPAELPVGEEIGQARIVLDDQILSSVPLVVSETIGKRDYGYELERFLRLWPIVPEEMAQ